LSLAVVIPVLNHSDETIRCVASFRESAADWRSIELVVVDNGSEPPAADWGIEEATIVRNDVNVGVLPALDQGYRATTAGVIVFTHNDVRVFEEAWDRKVARVFRNRKRVGVAGLFGAKGLGSSSLYATPYAIGQLQRFENVSGCRRMPSHHGHRPPRDEVEAVAVVDGFCLIVRRALLDALDGFDLRLPPHHNYDNHTCLQSLDLGYENVVIDLDAFHHGGVTDVSEPWNEPFGKSKQEIHEEAHYPFFYEYWRPGKRTVSLPIAVD
jgi:GT2 family glycosyltransferase